MSTFTQTQIDALTNAIAQGVTEVVHNGKRVRYASIEVMLSLRDRMMRELEQQTADVERPLAHRSVFFRS